MEKRRALYINICIISYLCLGLVFLGRPQLLFTGMTFVFLLAVSYRLRDHFFLREGGITKGQRTMIIVFIILNYIGIFVTVYAHGFEWPAYDYITYGMAALYILLMGVYLNAILSVDLQSNNSEGTQ